MEIERLGPGDEATVARIGATLFDHAPREDWTAAFLADPANLLLVARGEGDEAIGMLTATRLEHPDKPPELLVREVGVVDVARRRGVGTSLVRAAIELAPAMGCAETWLVTETDNDAAMGLYDALGGTATGDAVVWTWPAG